MRSLPGRSIDLIVTDPPYIAAYRSRDNQTIRNDDNAECLVPSYAEMHRVLKNDACAISFYGWPKVDLFFAARKQAGFRIGGHIVFRKRYASKTAFLQYRHEAAFLLIKGNPAFPAALLPDVMDWTYTGNKLHPTQKSIHVLKSLIQAFTQPGQLVMDRSPVPVPHAWRRIVPGATTSASSLTRDSTLSPTRDSSSQTNSADHARVVQHRRGFSSGLENSARHESEKAPESPVTRCVAVSCPSKFSELGKPRNSKARQWRAVQSGVNRGISRSVTGPSFPENPT